MTEHKALKARIRARMARTGERYVTARRHVVGEAAAVGAEDHGYRLRGGVHPDTAAIANVLANLDVTAGHTGGPLSEAMVLGAGGGLGAGYILWEFESHHARVLTLGFRNAWQYPDRWAAKTLERLGVQAEVHHTGGVRTAAAHLDAVLERGRPAIAWIDQQLLGTWHLPPFLEGHAGYPIVVHGQDRERMLVDDRNLAPLSVPRQTLAAARARIGSYRNRLIVLEPAGVIGEERLRAAVQAGLADAAEHLSQPSDSFSLPAWRKWSRLLVDTHNAKAWPRVFADPAGLVGALVSTYEGIEPIGTQGGNLRGLYADFIDEAAGLLGRPELAGVGERFRAAAALWHDLADAALPRSEPDLAAIRDLLAAVHAHVVGEGDAGADAAAAAAGELWALRRRWRAASPFEQAAASALFGDLSRGVHAIFEEEKAAAAQLVRLLT